LWRNFATSGARSGEYEIYVPFGTELGSARFGVYSFGAYTGGVMHLGRIKEGVVVVNKWHNDGTVTKTGSWSSTSNATAIPGPGTAAYSATAGDTIQATVTGHTLIVRGYTNINGGFGLVAIDGDYSAAAWLPEVTSGDFKAITNVVSGPGGVCRVTCAGHGFATGATVLVENAGGVTGLNNLRHTITSIDANTFDCDGSTFGGTYTSGGTAGYFAQADLGRRVLNTYSISISAFDEHFTLVEGLADGAHTITLRATGTAQAGGASGRRCYAVGFAAASAGQRLTDANASMGYLRDIVNHRASNAYSAIVSAIDYTPTGFSNYQFLGEIHGNEAAVSLAWKVDGATVTPAAGELLAGSVLRLERTTTLSHPSTGATVATKVAEYQAAAGQPDALRCGQTITWSNAGTVRSGYHGMLPIADHPRTTSVLRQLPFNRALVGETLINSLTADNDSQLASSQATRVEFFHASAHRLRVRATMPAPDKNVNGWSDPSSQAFVQDRSDRVDKAYFARSANGAEAVAVNDVHASETGWHVWRS
jgi:hypothetical protein